MKFGICLPHYNLPIRASGLLEVATRAEDLGFDSIWVTDHIIVPKSLNIGYREHMLEPLALMAYLGGVTKKVAIGSSVFILPYRNPIVMAKAVATADVLSGGRIIFGAAVGWMEAEFQALGAPFADRGARSDEYLRLIKLLWSEGVSSFQGRYFQFQDMAFSPQPVQRPHPPIWIGGRSRRAIRRAAEHGDAWHPTGMTHDQLEKEASYFKKMWAAKGRTGEPQITMRGGLNITDNALGSERRALNGSASQIREDIQRYASLDVSHIIMDMAGNSYEAKIKSMERFVKEIRPRLS
ncbi:MAG: LLM class F420-dependent oxidoreductase [Chloroflexi bacterium]|nr:LLM class F420-dependent oxidoreductase [Chloroflexota bacterium]